MQLATGTEFLRPAAYCKHLMCKNLSIRVSGGIMVKSFKMANR
jgi:hypothetical protein